MTGEQDWEIASHPQRPIDPAAVLALFAAESWWPERDVESMAGVLAQGPAAGAWTENRLVGFARAVTDGAFRAYVEDVVVAPQLRGTGIARALISDLLAQVPAGVTVSLFCSPRLQPLYAALGFAPTDQIVMHLES